MIRNLDSGVTRGRGNGSDKPAHHKSHIRGKPTKLSLDGCYKWHCCDTCQLPVDQCNGALQPGD